VFAGSKTRRGARGQNPIACLPVTGLEDCRHTKTTQWETRKAQIADIGVEPRSERSLPAIRTMAVARARSDSERRHGLSMLSVAQAGWMRT
jgi:hypothetical protein